MIRIRFLGTCSGTEPMPGMHQCSLLFEIGGALYWFDAGESCSHTAHTMGIDLLSVSDIFISHPHIDHVGGLANLLWTIRKLWTRTKQLPRYGDVTVYTPCLKTMEGVMIILGQGENHYSCPYRTVSKRITDGVLLETDDVKVTALHNNHLSKGEDGWQSFSFCMEAEGKKVIYSGDIRSLDDIAVWLDDGCDLLLMETGHHDPESICKALQGSRVRGLRFLHNGRTILYDYEGTLDACRKIIPSVAISNDRDTFEV